MGFHGTTIIAVRHEGRVALGGDGQVTTGDTIMKSGAQKVRDLWQQKDLGTSRDAFSAKVPRHGA